MRFSAHTNATGGYRIEDSINLFAKLGFKGIEIGCNELSGVSTSLRRRERRKVATYAQDVGIEIVNLASYAGERDGLNSDDPHVREETIQKQKEHILLAHDLDCRRARVFTGRERREETLEWNKAFEHSVIGFRELGEFAEKYGVTLLVENHPKSMAVSAQQTVNLVEAIGMKNVRILYDPSNLIVYAGEMDVERDFQLQRNYIAHVHVKDQVMLEDGRYVDAVPGRGAIPWKKILSLLKGIDYNGFLTMEYQRGWKSTGWLPDPEIGLKEGLEFLNRCLMNT